MFLATDENSVLRQGKTITQLLKTSTRNTFSYEATNVENHWKIDLADLVPDDATVNIRCYVDGHVKVPFRRKIERKKLHIQWDVCDIEHVQEFDGKLRTVVLIVDTFMEVEV